MSAKQKQEPFYKALAAELKDGILTGRLKNGERLPSKRAMASEKQLSLITVQNAYELLCAEGYLKSEERRGYFVSYSGKLIHDNPPVKIKPDTVKPRYDFSSSSTAAEGFPFYTWTRIMRETLSEKDTRLLSAIDPKGVYELRLEISKRLAMTRGIYCSPEQIIIGAGSEYLVGLVYQLLGRHNYAFENPGFTKAAKIYQRLGAQLDFIKTDDEGISTDLIKANNSLEVVHVTPSHSFPLGTVMSPGRRSELLEWVAEKPERRIVEDDFDSEFRYDGHSYPSLYSLDKSDSVVYMNTFTRTLAPSMRIGYMVLPPKLLAQFEQSFMFYSSTVPALEQYVLARFIADGSFERHINRMRKIYRSRRDTLISTLDAAFKDKVEILGKEAGVHLLVCLHGGLNEADIIARAKNVGILMSGISEFVPEGSGDILFSNALVVNFAGINENDITAAVRLLADSLNK